MDNVYYFDMAITTKSGHKYEIYSTATRVVVVNLNEGEITEADFPSEYFSSPNAFVGHVIGLDERYYD